CHGARLRPERDGETAGAPPALIARPAIAPLRGLPASTGVRALLCVILPLVVAAATFLSFLPALNAGFLSWDDETNLVDNLSYRGLGSAQLRWMFTSTVLGHYVPVAWISFGLNYLLCGMNPRGYHLGNLLVHAANAVVFYFVTRRLLEAAYDGGVEKRVRGDVELSLGAAFAVLIFGVHPLRVESVAWVTERRDVLCGLFSLL